MNKTALVALLCNLVWAAGASATSFTYFEITRAGSVTVGEVPRLRASYDTATGAFSWSFTIRSTNAQLSDGFWLALIDVPNPKGISGELTLLYGDIDAGKVMIYEYNGENAGTDYITPGNYIGTFTLSSAFTRRLSGNARIRS